MDRSPLKQPTAPRGRWIALVFAASSCVAGCSSIAGTNDSDVITDDAASGIFRWDGAGIPEASSPNDATTNTSDGSSTDASVATDAASQADGGDNQKDCPGGCPGCASQCIGGNCQAPAHQGSICLHGDAYWTDGCGALQERRQQCAPWQTCVGGTCGPTSASFVHTEGKAFVRDGQELVIKGVNYNSVYYPPLIGVSSAFDAANYRPAIVEDELAMLEGYGFNLASTIGISSATAANCAALRDFLDRARAHQIYVNLFIGVPHPNYFAADTLAATVRSCGLADHPALFAYDIAWEPRFGGEAERQSLSAAWEQWLVERYGSLASANAAFGGGHALPNDTTLCAETANVLVSAFRRFLDDTVSDGYRHVRNAIRAVDPNHMIGARSGYGGNGAQWICPQAPFDMRAGAINLDMISPEGYALSPTDRTNVLDRGGFTTAYADLGKPVFWAEYGINTDSSCTYCTPTGQRDFLLNVIDMMQLRGANGGAVWWFAGTRPQNTTDAEVSDYGIVYDYARYPTSVDAAGSPMRNGWLALCTATPARYGLYVAHDDYTGTSYPCPAGTAARGSFKPDAVARGSGPTASDPLGRQLESGWLALCGADNDAQLVVLYDDYTTASWSCPSGTTEAGRFKVDSVAAGAGQTGTDTLGHAIESGWIGLCVRNSAATLDRIQSGLSGSSYTCPAGTTASGQFKPDVAPLIKPSAIAIKTANQSFAPNTSRHYDRWVTVDRDSHAGYWKSFDLGLSEYIAQAGGGQQVGVRTPCTGSTSKTAQQCVGNAGSIGACPAKCLNAEWVAIEIRDRDGRWTRVSDGQTVAVASGQPVRARFSAGNTGEGTWLTTTSAGGNAGAVRFGCNENITSALSCRIDIPSDTPFLGQADSGEVTISPGLTSATPVVFQLVAENVTWFGDQLRITLAP